MSHVKMENLTFSMIMATKSNFQNQAKKLSFIFKIPLKMEKVYKGFIPEISITLKRGAEHKCKITGSKDAAELFRLFIDEDTIECYEQSVVLYLNRANNTIGWFKVSQGGLAGTVIDVRLIFATGLGMLSTSMILCHNHPSGNLNPSEQDAKITRQVKEAGKILDMPILDHIIIAPNTKDYFSFADEGYL